MASCRATVNLALRKLGVLASGREARAADATDALVALQGLYRSWIAAGAFGRLCDVVPMGNYTACGNERVFRNDPSVTTITLPATVASGWVWDCRSGSLQHQTLDDSYGDPLRDDLGDDLEDETFDYRRGVIGATPRDGAVVVVIDAFTGVDVDFLYDGSSKLWQGLYALGLDDPAPRSFADPTGLAACLAMELQDQFSGDLSQVTLAQARRYMDAMTMRFSMPREEAVGVYV